MLSSFWHQRSSCHGWRWTPIVIRMHLTARDKTRISGSFTVVREPDRPDVAAQSDPAVITTVSTMLSEIEAGGLAAVRRYAERLDGWTGGEDFEITPEADRAADVAASRPDLRDGPGRRRRAHVPIRRDATRAPARLRGGGLSRGGLRTEVRPGRTVGAYLPAGRFPLLASAFMTVGVARAAGVPNVVCATPPSAGRPAAPGRAVRRPGLAARIGSSPSAASRPWRPWRSACSTASAPT